MPHLLSTLLFLTLAFSSCQMPPSNGAPQSHVGHLRHVVWFKFKPETTAEQIATIEAAFAKLPGQIPSIIDFEWGTDVGVEDMADGFTHCFLVTFADEAGRDEYLPHPAHKAFVAIAKPSFDKVQVIDYFVR